MLLKSLTYLILVCSFFLNHYAHAQDFKFWHLDSRNGLPSATINTLLQDNQGFMWLGTIDGLYKYDGYSFKSFKFRQGDTQGLWGSNINILYEDSRQTLWIGTTGKGLHYYDKNQEKIIRLSKTEGMYINALKEDKNGELWLNNNGLLGKLDLKNLSFRPPTN
jgi:ligand-binding sensor domain-containing protein